MRAQQFQCCNVSTQFFNMISPVRENIDIDCPDPNCMGWLSKVTTQFGAKLKCSEANCSRNCIFSKKVSECSLCLGVIRVGDVITHDDIQDTPYLPWVHITCFVCPPIKTVRTCERCSKEIEDDNFIDDGTAYLHNRCVPKKRKQAMEEGAVATPIRGPRINAKKPIKVASSSSTDDKSTPDDFPAKFSF